MKNREREIEDLLAATYYAAGESYESISEITGRSLSEVARSLRRVRESGRLPTYVVYGDDPASAAATETQVMDRMRDKGLEEKVRLRLGPAFISDPNSVWVCRGFPERQGKRPKAHDYDLYLERTAGLAAIRLTRYLAGRPDASVGISWGRTLERVVHWLEMKKGAGPGRGGRLFPGVMVFNTAGDFYGHDYWNPEAGHERRALFAWSSDLAKRLAVALGSAKPGHFFFAPGWIPLSAGDALRRREEVYGLYGQYCEFADIHNKYIPEASVLLTGIGNPATTRGLLESTGRLRERDIRHVVGDLSHHLLKADGLDDSPYARLIAATAVGATAQQYLSVAAAARRPGSRRLGVMAVCVDPSKRTAVLACAAAGLLNVLVCDPLLAAALCSA